MSWLSLAHHYMRSPDPLLLFFLLSSVREGSTREVGQREVVLWNSDGLMPRNGGGEDQGREGVLRNWVGLKPP